MNIVISRIKESIHHVRWTIYIKKKNLERNVAYRDNMSVIFFQNKIHKKKKKEFENEYLVFPQNIPVNQQSATRCSINANNRWRERLEDRGCLRLWRRAIVLWQAVGSKRENHGLISRKWGRERGKREAKPAKGINWKAEREKGNCRGRESATRIGRRCV